MDMVSVIFLKKKKRKESSGTHRVTQNSVGDGVIYTHSRERTSQNAVPGCVLLRNNFRNCVSMCSVTWV
jgi:hypothetical protein